MNGRLKIIRNALNLSQAEFASRLGLNAKSHISSLETGRRVVTDRLINDICREFNVNENWLRYGEGEMFVENDYINFDEFMKQKQATPLEIEIIKAYLSIEPSKRKEALQTFKNLINHVDAIENETLNDSKDDISATVEKKIERKVELYRKELIDVEKGATLSATHMQRKNIS